jgi:hypothetical protein
LHDRERESGRAHAVRVGREFEHVAIFGWQRDGEGTPDLERQAPTRSRARSKRAAITSSAMLDSIDNPGRRDDRNARRA